MLKRLRVQLTVLYILAALGLAALISAGAYLLLGYYFQQQTDLALSYKMASTFKQYNLPLTPELLQAEREYHGEGLRGHEASLRRHVGAYRAGKDHQLVAGQERIRAPGARQQEHNSRPAQA